MCKHWIIAEELIAGVRVPEGTISVRPAVGDGHGIYTVIYTWDIFNRWVGTLYIQPDKIRFEPLGILEFEKAGLNKTRVTVDMCDPDGFSAITDSLRVAALIVSEYCKDRPDLDALGPFAAVLERFRHVLNGGAVLDDQR